MKKAKIDRINELARKSKVQPLSEEEKQEQQTLRREYIDSMKHSLRSTLDSSVIVRPDGPRERVSERKKEK